jgi:hypothetical protein
MMICCKIAHGRIKNVDMSTRMHGVTNQKTVISIPALIISDGSAWQQNWISHKHHSDP